MNETSLRLWFKHTSRLQEISTLLQGHPNPDKISVSTTPLPSLHATPSHLQGQCEEKTFVEPEDCSNIAKLVFRVKNPKDTVSSTSSSTITKPMPTSTNNITMPTESAPTFFQRPTFEPAATTIHMQQTITKPMPTSTNNITMPIESASTFQRSKFVPATT